MTTRHETRINLQEVRGLLVEAATLLNETQAERAAWRIADAGGLLRVYLDATLRGHVIGCGEPTGRGCLLPTVSPEEG